MTTLEDAKKKAEKVAIEANLEELRRDEDFNSSTNNTKMMRLALACGISLQAMSAKLKANNITL